VRAWREDWQSRDGGQLELQDGEHERPRPLDASSHAAMRKDGAFPTYLALDGCDALLGTRPAVKVAGTLDVHPFGATLMPSGSRPHRLPLRCARPSARPTPVSRSTSTCSSAYVP
jgi:Domain of unknown function (DUF1905)